MNVWIPTRDFDQIEIHRDNVQMGLINATSNDTREARRAVLKDADLGTEWCDNVRNGLRKRVQIRPLLRGELSERKRFLPGNNEEPSGHQGPQSRDDSTLGAGCQVDVARGIGPETIT